MYGEEFENDDVRRMFDAVPRVPKPNRNGITVTTLVIRPTAALGMDKPMQLFQSYLPPTTTRIIDHMVFNLLVVDDVSGETLAAESFDLPFVVHGMNLMDVPDFDKSWDIISQDLLNKLSIKATALAMLKVGSDLSGGLTGRDLDRWLEANVPQQGDDYTDTESGTGYLMARWHLWRKGETSFTVSDYGHAVKLVTDDGWDEYVSWATENNHVATGDDLIGLMDKMPEYIDHKYGLKPQA